MWWFRRKDRCPNISPSEFPAYANRQCEREARHDGVCRIKVGAYYHCWRQEFYDRLGRAKTKT